MPAQEVTGMWRPGSKPHAVGRYVWSLVAAVVRHDIMSLAAVITFYAFFSLFPFLLLVIYTASTIVPQLDVQNVDVQRVLMHLIGPFVPALQAEKVIQQNISNLAVVGRQIGLFSALTLTWSAMSGFLAVQQAMDVIWEREQRSFIARHHAVFGAGHHHIPVVGASRSAGGLVGLVDLVAGLVKSVVSRVFAHQFSYFLPLPSFAPRCVAIRGSGCTRGDASARLRAEVVCLVCESPRPLLFDLRDADGGDASPVVDLRRQYCDVVRRRSVGCTRADGAGGR
jgi:hypothetical protein